MKNNWLQRIKQAVIESYGNRLDSMDLNELQEEMSRLGVSLDVSVSVGNGAPRRRASAAALGKGQKRYWAAVAKLAAEKGVDMADARQLYKELKVSGKVGNANRRTKGQLKYHRAVKKIMRELNVDKKKALQVYKERKATV